MKIRLARPLQQDSIVDGEGLRTVIWTQGCSHNCFGCHNPNTHSFEGGYLEEIDKIKNQLNELTNQDGITLSGGDPFFQIDASIAIAKHAQKLGLNVWAYTGYTFEQLLILSNKNKKIITLLKNIDILVDGRFDITKRSLDWKFRGSTNQRILDVPKSLKNGKAIIIKKYNKKSNNNLLSLREKYIYI